MKKRAALLLILPAFGALIGGCTVPNGVKNAVFKTKEVVSNVVHKTMNALDKFFEEPKAEEKKEETKPEEKTTEENTTTIPETGESEGQEESGEETGSEED